MLKKNNHGEIFQENIIGSVTFYSNEYRKQKYVLQIWAHTSPPKPDNALVFSSCFPNCRLSRTEARLSQSLDENRRLREDLKEMLDSQVELQQSLLADPGQVSKFSAGRSRTVKGHWKL